ncbi:MAG: H-NS histone family protein [Aquabacterium sp.]|nr:H-NS histone family protein [Aquabacterium sp.]
MTTYAELKAQGEALMRQAEQVRKQEINAVVQEIKAKMREYGLTISDIDAPASRPKSAGKSKSQAPAKYRGPNGELWAGGLGRKPEWVHSVIAQGKSIDEYLI